MENTEKKIRIAIIAPDMNAVGGQSIQANRLIEAFTYDKQIFVELIANNPKLTIFSFLQNIPIIKTLATSLKFWFLLLKKMPKFDVIQVFSSGTTSYLISTLPPLFLAKILSKKTILNYHHGGLEEHLTDWKLTAKPTMKMFNEIVVPSQFLVDVFAKFNLSAQSISNFVETKKFIFRERNPLRPIFLSNRNFDVHYNVGNILTAFQIIQKRIPDAGLIVAGFGVEENKLKLLATNLKLENVEFIGKIPNEEMPKIYDQADIYLNSSIVDNMPLSFIEAFSCGLPIISSKTGGIPYLVTSGKTGILLDNNSPELLAEKAVMLLRNNDLAQVLIANSQRELEKYSWENVKQKWREFYLKLTF